MRNPASSGIPGSDTGAHGIILAKAYRATGRTADALALYEANLELEPRETKLGPDADALYSRDDLAKAYRAAGRAADAIALYEGTSTLLEAK